jgi:hypothetical protein
MKLKLVFASVAALSLATCSRDEVQETPTPSPTNIQSEEARTTAINEGYAIVRAPLDIHGEPDLSKAELQTQALVKSANLDDSAVAESFTSLGTLASSKSASSFEELDATSSTESWFLLPWRARVAAGIPVRSGPYLLPWRRAVANGYPVRAGGYLLPFRSFVANSYGYYMYNYGQNCWNPCNTIGGGYYPIPSQVPIEPTPYY